ncbi:MAG: DHH family phosphoesterase [Candidatus Saccharibacteria bacterium]|nr:DHH family phosphoesterase [Candidatus Saccharibacteria bacterium]
MFSKLNQLVESASKINLIIANNPDADSVGSALALREIFETLNKTVYLYCHVDIPVYLHFLKNWHDIQKSFISDYDLAIMVDNSTQTLLQNPQRPDLIHSLKVKPFVILDHHTSQTDIDFADEIINQPQMVATGQLIYKIAQVLNWPINQLIANYLSSSILSDSLGFTSQVMVNNPEPLRVVGDLVELGADLHQLAQDRLKYQQIPANLVSYKAELLKRIEFYHENQLALITIPHSEIKEYSSFFNPTIILDDMKIIEKVKLTVGFKQYYDQSNNLIRITSRIRCLKDCQIAQELAEAFGGGGHPYASGVKFENSNLDFIEIKKALIETAGQLLDKESMDGA